MADSSDHNNERSGSFKDGKFLNKLSDNKLVKEVSAPWNCRVPFLIVLSNTNVFGNIAL
jgi:hypothetical protein